ncbi:hypothetical protein BH11ACT6_BH11ACT6_53520 [soil metagenome]
MRENSATPEVSLPPGAEDDRTDHWEPAQDGKLAYRLVWSGPFGPTEIGLRVVVVQFADGTIGIEGDDAPLVHFGQEVFSPAEARLLATEILRAADLAEEWVR